jgi:hypothetical protein
MAHISPLQQIINVLVECRAYVRADYEKSTDPAEKYFAGLLIEKIEHCLSGGVLS